MKRTVFVVMMTTAVSLPVAWSIEDGQSFSRRHTRFNPLRQSRPLRSQLKDMFEQVMITNIPARDTLNWWSRTTGINLVVNWRGLEEFNIDPQTPINVDLHHARIGQVLTTILSQMSLQEPLIYKTTRYYIEVLTKEQANRLTETLTYDISDLLAVAPNFNTAPKFDLNAAMSNTNSGGSGTTYSNRSGASGLSSGIFADNDIDDQGPKKKRVQHGEELAQLIRDTIEPKIWTSHGGEYAFIRYHQGLLVIKAPQYIHEQIGLPIKSFKLSPALDNPLWTKTSSSRSRQAEMQHSIKRSSDNCVSGIGLANPQHISGIRR